MELFKYLYKNVKIELSNECDDDVIYAKVVAHTTAMDNEESDDDGNGAGEYIEVRTIEPTIHFPIGGEFCVHLYEIKSIKVID